MGVLTRHMDQMVLQEGRTSATFRALSEEIDALKKQAEEQAKLISEQAKLISELISSSAPCRGGSSFTLTTRGRTYISSSLQATITHRS